MPDLFSIHIPFLLLAQQQKITGKRWTGRGKFFSYLILTARDDGRKIIWFDKIIVIWIKYTFNRLLQHWSLRNIQWWPFCESSLTSKRAKRKSPIPSREVCFCPLPSRTFDWCPFTEETSKPAGKNIRIDGPKEHDLPLMCVCVCAYACVCMCVCVCERERERESNHPSHLLWCSMMLNSLVREKWVKPFGTFWLLGNWISGHDMIL